MNVVPSYRPLKNVFYASEKDYRATFSKVQSLLKNPNSCLTQLLCMHTSFQANEISKAQLFYDKRKISCNLDIVPQLLGKIVQQNIADGHDTYLHCNSINSVWMDQNNRKVLGQVISSQVRATPKGRIFPQIRISYDGTNMQHGFFAKQIIARLRSADIPGSENPLDTKTFLQQSKHLEFPILDWEAIGLEPKLLAQLMFDENSSWSLKNAQKLVSNSRSEDASELHDLAFKIS